MIYLANSKDWFPIVSGASKQTKCLCSLPWCCSTIFGELWYMEYPSAPCILPKKTLSFRTFWRERSGRGYETGSRDWCLWAQFFETRRADFGIDTCLQRSFGGPNVSNFLPWIASRFTRPPVWSKNCWPSVGNEAALLETCDARARLAETQASGRCKGIHLRWKPGMYYPDSMHTVVKNRFWT